MLLLGRIYQEVTGDCHSCGELDASASPTAYPNLVTAGRASGKQQARS
jgi:hypothetical protein